jgi:hypothetical protein
MMSLCCPVEGRDLQRLRSPLDTKPIHNHIAACMAGVFTRTNISNKRGRSHDNWSFIGYNDVELAHEPETDNGKGWRERGGRLLTWI